ncbi:MAG: BMC domain-containing protein [Acidimicrobiia bacterium]|nr:BMC domain-containing protein [Acidimicrobiia bacterium]MDH3470777.1 BMC domain-containing protein [Acidimicrobiia bacterium]
MQPALALLEFSSIARGIEAGDAMVKKASLDAVFSGVIQPGKYLVLIGGEVANVEESAAAGEAVGGSSITDRMLLSDVHPDVVNSLGGARPVAAGRSVGILETTTVAAIVEAADAGVKTAAVELLELHFEGLGGKGYLIFGGDVAEVEAAVDAAAAKAGHRLEASVVIPQAHPEMLENLQAHSRFESRVRGN